VNYTARAAMPARYVLERGDWKAAAVLSPTKSAFPQADSISHFTRGIGSARTGDLAGAKREIETIAALRKKLQETNQSYWADRSEEQMLAVSAWIAFREGQRDQALKLMRAAADGEDRAVKHVAMENRLYPMRELLAELLLEMKEPAAAMREYETALRDNRNRLRGYWRVARAAEALGDRQKASDYFTRLLDLAKNADSDRDEIRQAKAFLARK
jgi:tetratricopeptide (TPR) repeat protein